MYRRLLVVLSSAGFAGCSTTPEETPANVIALQDYVAVAELPEVNKFRIDRNYGVERFNNNPRYVLVKGRRQQAYLVEFGRDCWEILSNIDVTPDVRRNGDYLYAGRDTIRGCRISRAFELNQGQLEEIRDLGEAPTGG